jgi:hypothetical protein
MRPGPRSADHTRRPHIAFVNDSSHIQNRANSDIREFGEPVVQNSLKLVAVGQSPEQLQLGDLPVDDPASAIALSA